MLNLQDLNFFSFFAHFISIIQMFSLHANCSLVTLQDPPLSLSMSRSLTAIFCLFLSVLLMGRQFSEVLPRRTFTHKYVWWVRKIVYASISVHIRSCRVCVQYVYINVFFTFNNICFWEYTGFPLPLLKVLIRKTHTGKHMHTVLS